MFCLSNRLQLEDIQQSRIRRAALSVGEPGLRGSLPAHEDVHDQDELREGLGRRVPPTDGHLDTVLDRTAPERPAPVARPGAHSNGLAPAAV